MVDRLKYQKFSSKKNYYEFKNLDRYALHAYKIKFTHPISKLMIELKAPIPNDFKKIINLFDEK